MRPSRNMAKPGAGPIGQCETCSGRARTVNVELSLTTSDSEAVAYSPPAVPSDALEARAQGRAEALAIILGLDAEQGLDEYVDSIPPGPAGEWGTAWNEGKLRKLLRADDTAWSLLQESEGEYWHNLGLREEAERMTSRPTIAPQGGGVTGWSMRDGVRVFDVAPFSDFAQPQKFVLKSDFDSVASQATHPAVDDLTAEVARLRGLLNTPHTTDWFDGVRLEAGHQIERWGVEHDVGKQPSDWFWLIGYLAGKALAAAMAGNVDKALHHTISTGAALLNWHRAMSGDNNAMQPGHAPSIAMADRSVKA